MDKLLKNVLRNAVLLGVGSSVVFGADAWEDIVKSSTENLTITSGSNQVGSLYKSSFTYFIQDGDGIGDNFSDADKIRLTITGGGKSITTGTGFLTNDELEDWAEANADDLFVAIFDGDPSSSFAGTDSTIQNSSDLIKNVSKPKVAALYFGDHYSSQVMMGAESADIEDKDVNIESTAGIFSYESDLESGNAWGIVVPYRDSTSDDRYGSKSKSIAFLPYYKIKTVESDDLSINYVLNPTVKITYLESTLFPDGGGYFEYGGGAGMVPTYAINEELSITGSLNYQYSKKSFPDSAVPEELKFVADAINALPAQQVLSASLGADYVYEKSSMFSCEILHSEHLDDDAVAEGREKATNYAVQASFPVGSILVQLGYKTVEGVDDYSENAYMSKFSYIW